MFCLDAAQEFHTSPVSTAPNTPQMPRSDKAISVGKDKEHEDEIGEEISVHTIEAASEESTGSEGKKSRTYNNVKYDIVSQNST